SSRSGTGANRDRARRRAAGAPARPLVARAGRARARGFRGRPALALRDWRERGRATRRTGARTACGGARTAAPPRPPALVPRAVALRALLVPLLRRAGDRAAAGRGRRLGAGS